MRSLWTTIYVEYSYLVFFFIVEIQFLTMK